MSDIQITKETTSLKEAIDTALLALKELTPGSDEYAKVVDQLDKLYKMNALKGANRVSADGWLAAGASLAGIVAILAYEHAHVVVSKAVGFVPKIKI